MKINWSDLSKYRNQLYGLAMFWIVIFHVWEEFKDIFPNGNSLVSIIKNGNLGVEIFLFLSGISMYFAIQKYVEPTGRIRVGEFLKKRAAGILKVYFVFCVPFYVLAYLVLKWNPKLFLQQLFFCRSGVSSFWFLLCIMICYCIYPYLYQLIKKSKITMIGVGLVIYIGGLMLLCVFANDYYLKYEILLSRLPVFIVGAVCGKKVYEKSEMNVLWLVLSILVVLSKAPALGVLKRSLPFFSEYSTVVNRLYGAIIGVSAIICLTALLKYLENTKIYDLFGFLGTYTLETYVSHVAYRYLLLRMFEFLHIKIDSLKEVLVLLIVYTITSFVWGYILASALKNRTPVSKLKK